MLLALTPQTNNDSIRLKNKANELHWDTLICKGDYKKFTITDGVPYGDPLICERIANEFKWNLMQNANNWLASLPTAFLKREVECMSITEASRLMERKHFSSPEEMFCPRIFENGQAFIETNGSDTIWNSLPTIVSEPVMWRNKYRCVIKNNKLLTWCCYNFNGEYNNSINYKKGNPENIINSLLDFVDCAAGCIIDVGEIEDRGLAIMNTMPIWSAQIFGCDLEKFMEALKASCKKMDSD